VLFLAESSVSFQEACSTLRQVRHPPPVAPTCLEMITAPSQGAAASGEHCYPLLLLLLLLLLLGALLAFLLLFGATAAR
jgi:hypothetical protein